VVNGVEGLRVEEQDAGIISQLNSFSSSNEGVETGVLICPGPMTGSSMWKLTRMEWVSGLRPHSGRCVYGQCSQVTLVMLPTVSW
jgi:hypothetical protein